MEGFCDSCESQVISKIFEIDTVKIFYKDYSNLANVETSFIPIDNRYLKSISGEKYIKDTSISNYINADVINNYSPSLNADTLLLKDRFIYFKDALLNSAQIDSFIRINKTSKYIRISKPIFSSDMNYVLVEVDYNCFGTCGEGYTYILKKKNNDWVLYKKIFRWVS